MEKHLHVISFDVPFPANYGGVIDVYYKVQVLAELGVNIHLHCFEYGRKPAPELEKLCTSVHYYHRSTSRRQLFRRKPFIVVSRSSDELLERLLQDDHPILFEGLHTCFHLADERLMNRFKVVRTHNIEHHYYANLAKVERSVPRKFYFLNEVEKLKRFERTLCNAQAVAAISRPDVNYLSGRYPNVHHISAFHPNGKVEVRSGRGNYCLYHGSLDVAENDRAAMYLIDQVFAHIDVPLVVAGNRPSKELRSAVEASPNVRLATDLNTEQIHDLIREAQINVLPTFQATGIKLKLLAALYMGRHCVVNGPMVENTGLEVLCRVEDTEKRMQRVIEELFETAFDASRIAQREEVLNARFCNRVNGEHLKRLIFGE